MSAEGIRLRHSDESFEEVRVCRETLRGPAERLRVHQVTLRLRHETLRLRRVKVRVCRETLRGRVTLRPFGGFLERFALIFFALLSARAAA